LPFTPFHIGPALLIYSVFLFLDPFALVIGGLIPDIEPFSRLYLGLGNAVHGPLHSLVGPIFLLPFTLLFTLLTWKVYARIHPSTKLRRTLWQVSLISALFGSYSHIFLDAFLYSEMNLAWPLPYWNPFLYQLPSFTIYNIALACFLIALPLIIIRRYR